LSEFGYLRSPDGDGSFHYPDACGIGKVLYHRTGPVTALLARIIAFGLYAFPDGACFAKAEELLRWVGLHASVAFDFFRFGSVEVTENDL
jgi:hypothetical protein